MLTHEQIKAKAESLIAERPFMRWAIGDQAKGIASTIASAVLADSARYMSTGATEMARQMMADRVVAQVKLMHGGSIIATILLNLVIGVLVRLIIDWWFSEQAKRQEH